MAFIDLSMINDQQKIKSSAELYTAVGAPQTDSLKFPGCLLGKPLTLEKAKQVPQRLGITPTRITGDEYCSGTLPSDVDLWKTSMQYLVWEWANKIYSMIFLRSQDICSNCHLVRFAP